MVYVLVAGTIHRNKERDARTYRCMPPSVVLRNRADSYGYERDMVYLRERNAVSKCNTVPCFMEQKIMTTPTEKQCREAQGNYERWLASVEEDAKRDDWHLKLTGSDVRQLCSIIRELENRPALPPIEGLVEELFKASSAVADPIPEDTYAIALHEAIDIIHQHYAKAADKPKVLAMGDSPIEELKKMAADAAEGDDTAADKNENIPLMVLVARCQLAWIEEGKSIHPHRLEQIHICLDYLERNNGAFKAKNNPLTLTDKQREEAIRVMALESLNVLRQKHQVPTLASLDGLDDKEISQLLKEQRAALDALLAYLDRRG